MPPRPLLVPLLVFAWIAPAAALDYITIDQAGRKTEIAGQIEVEAEDGGVMLLARDGVLWPVPKEELLGRRKDELPFAPLSRDELSAALLAELPAGFKVHHTKNYLLCYNTSSVYAQWVGGLYERLFAGFYNFWSRKGIELSPPKFPLVAIVFDSREAYAAFSRHELGDAGQSIIGYYSLRSNRMIMYDLTGFEELKIVGDRGSTTARINAILSQPAAERTVATIVHEATHQLAFNSGLQARFADIPFWVSEGLAIYFESPDLGSTKGWRRIGAVNTVNLLNFRKGLPTRRADAFATLLADDKQFRDPTTAADAYAQAWALNYFLLQTRSAEYSKYLQFIAGHKPLVTVEPAERIKHFQAHFGDDLARLEAEFLRFMRGVN
ncbi:MAG: DUF1570 domain-containing protein [Pirellulaceae bacterium]|nr:DUF1570 domain-containing protein [Pirellulaceae bacterium]